MGSKLLLKGVCEVDVQGTLFVPLDLTRQYFLLQGVQGRRNTPPK